MISATDNRTTEQLCKLLEERGEDYMRNGFNITWSYYNDPHTATESIDGTLIVTGLTPEQAIAATLGSDASAVRLAERLRSTADEMRNMGASTMTPHELLAFYASEVDKVADSLMYAATLGTDRHPYEQRITGDGSDWGEIMWDAYDNLIANACESCTPEQMRKLADHIRAELWSGTCEMVTSGTACNGNTDKRCTACGAYGIGEHYDGDEHIATPKFCPECGRKVRQ